MRVVGQALDRPAVLAAVILAALALLPLAVWLDLKNIAGHSLRTQAEGFDTMMSDIRAYYAQNVVAKVASHDGQAEATHDYHDEPGAIPIPATLSIELGRVIDGAANETVSYRFASDLPFAHRAPHDLDDFERDALAAFRADRSRDSPIVTVSGGLFDRTIRLASPVKMEGACVTCHNTHPASPQKDWKVGDVRGIQEITIEQPLAAGLFSFRYLAAYLFGAAAFGGLFAWAQWRQAKTIGRMNGELEETNAFLASISMKISKYLSPQIYRSIFAGERDATLMTERKKLTIFFCDIKDFTVTAERLQPEELTALLNEYFTQMSAIATEYGATLDKFIGDAILAFFGDPETKGTQGDARACVEMAVAMQRRLAQLRVDWRRRGIAAPFEARMGINTGFCNVGNFGSAERMDYTIIGAEANLAARLERVAEPGGIVLSYETYALVSDVVRAHPVAPISLKGISRQITPYVVEGLLVDEAAATDHDRQGEEADDATRVLVAFETLSQEERERVARAITRVLEGVRGRGSHAPDGSTAPTEWVRAPAE